MTVDRRLGEWTWTGRWSIRRCSFVEREVECPRNPHPWYNTYGKLGSINILVNLQTNYRDTSVSSADIY